MSDDLTACRAQLAAADEEREKFRLGFREQASRAADLLHKWETAEAQLAAAESEREAWRTQAVVAQGRAEAAEAMLARAESTVKATQQVANDYFDLWEGSEANLDAAREAWKRRIAAPWATNAGGVILDAVTTFYLDRALAPDAPVPVYRCEECGEEVPAGDVDNHGEHAVEYLTEDDRRYTKKCGPVRDVQP